MATVADVFVSVLLSDVDIIIVDDVVDNNGKDAPRVAARVTSESVPQHVLFLLQHHVVEFGVPSQGVIIAKPPEIYIHD
jgi:hypothetical protein